MRAFSLFWIIAIVGAALALPLTAGTSMEVNITTEPDISTGTHIVKIEADPGIEYSYELEGNTLLLHLSVFRGTPCEEVEVTSEALGDNTFRVVAHIIPTAEMCIQVVPPPTEAEVKLELDPMIPEVYVKIEREIEEPSHPEINIPEIHIPELPEPEIPEDCNTLLQRIQELEENEPELAMKLKWAYEEQCLLPNRCKWIKERIEELKESISREEEFNAELQRLMLLYKKCRIVQPLPVEPEPETPIEIINKTIAIKQALEEGNQWENLRAEIEQLKRQIQELKQTLEKAGKQIELMARQLASMVKVSPGKIVVEGEELNIPRAEIVVDQNRGLKIRIEQNEVVLEVNRAQAKAAVEITVTPEGKIISTVSGKTITVDPKEVMERAQKIIKEIRQVSLVDDGHTPKYVVEGETEGRLLWIFPVRFSVEIEVDAEQGAVIAEKKPWWSFLVFP